MVRKHLNEREPRPVSIKIAYCVFVCCVASKMFYFKLYWTIQKAFLLFFPRDAFPFGVEESRM